MRKLTLGKWFVHDSHIATKWESQDSHVGQKAAYCRVRDICSSWTWTGVGGGVIPIPLTLLTRKRGYGGMGNWVFFPCAILLSRRSSGQCSGVGKGIPSGPAGSPSLKPFRDRCHRVSVSKPGRWHQQGVGITASIFQSKQHMLFRMKRKWHTLWHLLFMWEFLQTALTLPNKSGL